MYKTIFNKRTSLKFKHFSNKGYSLFSVLGREVIVGTLSVATLTYAKANGISTEVSKITTDSLYRGAALELDEVSVTASRAPLAESQQARMVTVLSREDIAQAPVQSINDLLKYVASVDVRQRGPVGAQTDVSIRGGNYEQITILLNGVNINDPQTGHNAFDFPCDIADIERIEVLEGPAAHIYGTSSLLGAINIVTKQHDSSSLSAYAEGGSYGYAKMGARAKMNYLRWNHSFSGSYTRSDGYSRSKNGALNMDFNGGKVFYQGGYDDADICVKWHAGLSTKGYGSNTFYSNYSDEQYERTLKTYTAIQAENKRGIFRFHPIIYWNRNMDRFELFRNNPEAYPFNYHRTDVFGVNLNGYLDWKAGRTAFGAEMREEDLVSGNLGEKLTRIHHIHGTDRNYTNGINRTNVQFILEHNILLRNFTFSMGITAVKNSWSEMNMRVYPAVEACYRLNENWKVYASYNYSLRMPSVTELYYNSKGYNANRNLKPEELSALEFGIKYNSNPVQASANVFFNHYTNLIDWIIDEKADSAVLTTTNFGKINAIGVEANININFSELLPNQHFLKKLTLQYAYLNQDQKQYDGITSRYVLEYLRHKLVANIQMNLWKSLHLGVNYRFQKRNGNYVIGYDEATKTNLLKKYSPYSVVDARLSWNRPNYSIYIEGNNILSHRYVDFGRLQQPGFWFIAGAKINITL
ncbi:MAG: TonB-dependent receptor [Prevotella sp.]|nr:TonB-dependent receptor [Prevotella sp.]